MALWRRKPEKPVADDRGDTAYAHLPGHLRPGHELRLLRGGGETYPAMLEAIAAATSSVLLETYVLADDSVGLRFADALAARARAGVSVRLLHDAVGAFSLSPAYLARLAEAGVEVVAYHPVAPWRPRHGWNRRDHRKVLVVDGRVGFVGGTNLAREYDAAPAGEGWHDLHARVEGPCVAELARLFRKTWLDAGGAPFPPLDPAAPAAGAALAAALGNQRRRQRATIRHAYLHAMRQAERSISLQNAYFIPDRGIRRVLANAARRGVAVSVVVPGRSDLASVSYASQHLWAGLLRSQVRIFVWSGPMMHAKAAVVDEVWATIGSYNLDSRSLFHNLEVVLEVVDRGFGAALEAQCATDRLACHELSLDEWARRPWWRRVLEWLFYQFRYWL